MGALREPSDLAPTSAALAAKGARNVLNTLLVVARSLLLSILIARTLGPSLQGVYSVLLYAIQVGVQLVSLGFPSTLVRFVAQRRGVADGTGARGVVSYVIRREIVLGSLATVLFIALARPLAESVAHGAPAWLFLLAALAILPDSLTLAYEASFEGMLAYNTLLSVNLALVPLSVAAASGVLLFGGRIAALLVLKVVLGVIRVMWYRRLLHHQLPRRGTLAPDGAREMRRYARSLSVIFLCDAVVWQRSEVLFLGLFCTREAIAFYDVAYQVVGTAMRVIPEKLTDILFPVLSSLEGRGDRVQAAGLYQRSTRLLFAVSLGIAVTLGVQADLLVNLLYGREYGPAAAVIRVLCAASPIVIVARATAYLLYAAGWQDFNMRLAGAAAVLNILLALILIPRNCIVGAALANSLTQSASVCVLVTYVVRRSGAGLPWGAMGRALLAGGAQGGVMLMARTVAGGWALLVGGAAVGLAVYGILLTALGVITPRERTVALRWMSRRGVPQDKTNAGGRN